MKRIMSKKKTTVLFLRNQNWRTVRSETEKVNNLLTYIPTNNITDLNDLIYEGAKLVCEKITRPKTADRKYKPGWELRLESRIKRLRQLAKIKKKRNIKMYSNETEKTQ